MLVKQLLAQNNPQIKLTHKLLKNMDKVPIKLPTITVKVLIKVPTLMVKGLIKLPMIMVKVLTNKLPTILEVVNLKEKLNLRI